MAVICVDLSKYQAGFNFQAFKDSGGLGVILKASESTTIKDSSYNKFRSDAKAAGLKVASYHFFRSTDPVAQANWYLDCANPDEGERVVCDVEDQSIPKGNVTKFLQRIQLVRPDLQLTVYTGNVGEEAEQKWGKSDWLAANTSLWTCQYSSSPSPWASQTWPQWSLWQYSDTGPVPGFDGDVDKNKFNGSDQNFLAWIGPAAVQPTPPDTQEPTVTVSFSSDQAVNLVVVAGDNVTIIGDAGAGVS
jgi:lysozyme